MLFNMFRPWARFEPGWLVIAAREDIFQPERYLLIQRRRWIKPLGEAEKMWVYDGILFKIENERLVYSTTTTCCIESSLRPIPGLEYPYDRARALIP